VSDPSAVKVVFAWAIHPKVRAAMAEMGIDLGQPGRSA
jgi:hypothetical protein